MLGTVTTQGLHVCQRITSHHKVQILAPISQKRTIKLRKAKELTQGHKQFVTQ